MYLKKVVIALTVQIAISKIIFSRLVKGQTERTILLAKLSGKTIYLTSKLLLCYSLAHLIFIYRCIHSIRQLLFSHIKHAQQFNVVFVESVINSAMWLKRDASYVWLLFRRFSNLRIPDNQFNTLL